MLDEKRLPIGLSEFRRLIEDNYYYVDKTKMIEELLRTGAMVTLITRPRRFGKTLNMTMLREFFSLDVDSKEIFSGLKIMDTKYASEINKYPVLFFSFKDANGSKEDIVQTIKGELKREFGRYLFLRESLKEIDLRMFEKILERLQDGFADDLTILSKAIYFLCQIVFEYHNIRPILLIDEYDTPMIAAYERNFYDELRDFFKILYSSALKDNPHLNFAVMTGIQRVAKENIFSGLNNLQVCTVTTKQYNDKFGLTYQETEEFLKHYGLELDNSVSAMYDGYNFFGEEIFNPWSIINYASEQELKPYWINTSSNALIRKLLAEASEEFYQGFETLISTGTVEVNADLATSFFEIQDTSTLWGLLVNSGYLTLAQKARHEYALDSFRIPNREVKKEFQSIVANYTKLREGSLKKLFNHLLNKQFVEFEKEYQQLILSCASFYDFKENAYHMLFLGMSFYVESIYTIKSNIEAGYGRADILFVTKDKCFPNIVMEFKQGDEVEKLASVAIKQIHEKKYYAGLTGETLLVGVAHSGKEVKIVSEVIVL